jgi:hypothetical protein
MRNESQKEARCPKIALRVGVTGLRTSKRAPLNLLTPQIQKVLQNIKDTMAEIAQHPQVGGVYRSDSPFLRIVSPLAEGADRSVAELALGMGYTLFAPLPFTQEEYEKDFPESVEEFRKLLERAEVLELDGERENFAEASYRALGEFVLRNCDILIAIWDGAHERGPGGTAEVVRRAAYARLPVWWINTKAPFSTRFIEGPNDLRFDIYPPEFQPQRLANYISRIVLPPQLKSSGAVSGIFHKFVQLFQRKLPAHNSPIYDYLNERPIRRFATWNVFGQLMSAFSQKKNYKETLNSADQGIKGYNYWMNLYNIADSLAVPYANRYRSSYIWLAFFAFLSLAADAASAPLPRDYEGGIVFIEMTSLLLIALLVFQNIHLKWHEKWISYRLLAELYRKQSVLAYLGRALPRPDIFLLSFNSLTESENAVERENWIGWYFAAAQRAAPFTTGSLKELNATARQICTQLCTEQITYHTHRMHRNRAINQAISIASEIAFVVTFGLVIIKLISVFNNNSEIVIWSSAFAGGFSAASGAFVGIRAYSEFSILARQSSCMTSLVQDVSAELSIIDPSAPLASQELGGLLDSLILAMLQDVSGWAQLFRIKAIEPGG